jgi:hypothetical protein
VYARVRERSVKGGKGGTGRKRPPAKPEPKDKSTQSASRGSRKRDWGAIEREVPVRPPDSKPTKR